MSLTVKFWHIEYLIVDGDFICNVTEFPLYNTTLKTLFEKFVSSLICLCLWKWTLVSNLSPCIVLAERNQREITTEVKKVFRRLISWRETLREQFCSTFQASRLLPPRILKFFRTFRSKEKSSFLPDFKLSTCHYYGIGRMECEVFIHLANSREVMEILMLSISSKESEVKHWKYSHF